MIDLHCHILPALDDGARDLYQSLAMAKMAVDSGITAVAATPHCNDDRSAEILESRQLLQEALQESGIPLKIYAGMEIFGTPDTARLLKKGKLLTLNGSRYPLVEFSFLSDGREETEILRQILDAGFLPIVAHPERYRYVQQNPELINRWKAMGCLLQINRGSLLGRFGDAARRVAFSLVERGFASAVASDAHGHHRRTPWLADVQELLSWEFSPQTARCLLEIYPRAVLNNEELPPEEPAWYE